MYLTIVGEAVNQTYMANCGPFTVLLFSLLLMNQAKADSSEEKQKCIEQLEGVATCLPYLGGNANVPTPDCCNGLILAIKNSSRCLCLVVKDRNDPGLRMNINITLTFRLPYLCKAPGNLSQCPAILHLDPNSPEARDFNQVNTNFTGSGDHTVTPTVESSPEGVRTGTPTKNEGCYNRKRMLVPVIWVAGLLIWLS